MQDLSVESQGGGKPILDKHYRYVLTWKWLKRHGYTYFWLLPM